MIGYIVLGALAAIGIGKYVRWRRMGGGWGCGGHWGHHRWGHHHHGRMFGPWGRHHHDDGYFAGYDGDDRDGPPDDWGGPMRGRGGGFVLRYLSGRLEATPAQERVLREAWEEMEGELKTLRGEGKKTREELAAALRKPAFDEVLMGELFARHDGHIEKVRKAFVGLVARTHDALDEKQRDRLASIIERGRRFVPPAFGRGGW